MGSEGILVSNLATQSHSQDSTYWFVSVWKFTVFPPSDFCIFEDFDFGTVTENCHLIPCVWKAAWDLQNDVLWSLIGFLFANIFFYETLYFSFWIFGIVLSLLQHTLFQNSDDTTRPTLGGLVSLEILGKDQRGKTRGVRSTSLV